MTEHDGIPVFSRDGAQGRIIGPPPDASVAEQVLVQFDDGARVYVPGDALVAQADGSYYYLPLRRADLAGLTASAVPDQGALVLPVIEEQLDVQKRRVETGRVRVHKLVREREELIDEPLLREVVEVERVPVNQVVDAAVPVRQEGDTLIIPVVEEVLVVEKRLMLTEEVRIIRRQVTDRQPQHVTLRREEVQIERLDPPAGAQDAGTDRAAADGYAVPDPATQVRAGEERERAREKE